MVAWKYPLMKGRYLLAEVTLPAKVTQRFGAFLEYLVTHGTSPFRIVCSWLKTDLEKGQLILPGSVVQLRGRVHWDEMRKQCVCAQWLQGILQYFADLRSFYTPCLIDPH